LARETYLDAFGAAAFAGSLGMSQLREVCLAAREAPAADDPQRLPDLLLDGLSLLITDGLATAMPALRNAIRAFPHEELAVEKGLQWGTLAAAAATTLWDFESVQAIYDRQSELARRAGALVPLSLALSGNIFVMVHRGELDTAAELAAERDALADAVGLRHAPFSALFLEAFKGDEPRSSAFIEAAIDLVGPQGEGVAIRSMQGAAAVLALSLTRYELALPRAVQASAEASEFLIGSWVLPELVEAAARTGNEALAVDTIERLARSTSLSQTDWARGIFARCQALVSGGDTAEAHYRLGRTPLRPELARAHLLYGEWLRRHNRRNDARDQLRVAYGLFTEIGMLAFAERAGRELRATGEAVRKRREAEHNDLTPQEEQIARLALEGRTNPEIGAQLFISARTVEWHLRKVFAKLGITSRRGLRDVLPVRAPNDSRN
jgi:DNA-binding CsgD family transcriptional regulator